MDKQQLIEFKKQLLKRKAKLQAAIDAVEVLLEADKRPYHKTGKYNKVATKPNLIVLPKKKRGRPKKV